MKKIHIFLSFDLIVLGLFSIVSFIAMLPNNFIAGPVAFYKLSGIASMFVIYGALGIYYQLKRYSSLIQRLFFGHILFLLAVIAIYAFNITVVRTLILIYKNGSTLF